MYSKVIQIYIYVCVCVYTHIYVYILYKIIFHYDLSQYVEYSSLCYIVGLCCLCVLYIIVGIC